MKESWNYNVNGADYRDPNLNQQQSARQQLDGLWL
jgi:hypothetical protein